MLLFVYRDRFPYFKAEDERWKNSVRHNLSMNPHFRKGNKAKHGSGHLWVLADIDEEDDLTITKVKSLSTDTHGFKSLSMLALVYYKNPLVS